jgi:hypothetical protein
MFILNNLIFFFLTFLLNNPINVFKVKNCDSFFHFILNWDMWENSSIETQSLLFNSIIELLDPKVNGQRAHFNVYILLFQFKHSI